MSWWLAAVFMAIATLTAALIAAVSSRQADRELRANAENIALGAGISARSAVEQAIIDGNLAEQLPRSASATTSPCSSSRRSGA